MINHHINQGLRDKLNYFKEDIVKYYEIDLKQVENITNKAAKITDTYEKEYFVKETTPLAINKYTYLSNQGVSNILYPLTNVERKIITRTNNFTFYVNDYFPQSKIREDVVAYNLFKELDNLHMQTEIVKTLDPYLVRGRFDELSNQLDYKFRLIENYIRTLEAKPLKEYSYSILEKYHHILNAKKELIKLQKRIISSVKAKESVTYNFVHNKPSIDHLINVRGVNYLTSFDNGKIGIGALDMAKFYVENEYLNIDFKSLILNKYYDENKLFYYDYFRFIVLIIYVKRLNISTEDFINEAQFSKFEKSITKYYENFSDYKEQTSNPENTNN